MKQTSPLSKLTTEYVSELRKLIYGAQNIVITCHHNPDGDAIGSSLALARYISKLGKEVSVIIPDAYPDSCNGFPAHRKSFALTSIRKKQR